MVSNFLESNQYLRQTFGFSAWRIKENIANGLSRIQMGVAKIKSSFWIKIVAKNVKGEIARIISRQRLVFCFLFFVIILTPFFLFFSQMFMKTMNIPNCFLILGNKCNWICLFQVFL